MSNQENFDVIIAGGSYAGLSAAMALARSLRSVLIIDANNPCNKKAPHAHNFITHDGRPPGDIAHDARQQVMQYPTVTFLSDEADKVYKHSSSFEVFTKSGKQFSAQKILLATGLMDKAPSIPGFEACWGISILHCPYCHGYEVKDKKTVLLANDEVAYHTAMALTVWTQDLTILTDGPERIPAEHAQKLEDKGIAIDERPIREIVHTAGIISQIVFATGEKLDVSTVYAKIPFEQQSDLAEQLGCEMTGHGLISITDEQRTSIPGVFAAGDNSTPYRALSVAIAAGTLSGISINTELLAASLQASS